MLRRSSALVLALMLAAAVLAACGGSASQSTPVAGGSSDGTQQAGGGDSSPAAGGKKVALITPGLVDDGSWNQAGFEGLKQAEAEGIEIAYTERVTQDQQVEVFRNYARQGYDVVIGHGGEYMDAALQVAQEFPDVEFVVTNGNQSAANVTSFTLSYGDMGYLAGTLAGLMTQTNKVAIVSGQEIPVARDAIRGFEAGLKAANPDAELQVTFTGSWEDVDKAREAALALIGSGADVLWHVLDAADAGVLSAAEDEGVMVIGLYGDQSRFAPEAYLGSAIAESAKLVYKAATEELNHQVNSEGVKEGVISVGDFTDRVPQEVQDKVKAVEEDLRTGAVTY